MDIDFGRVHVASGATGFFGEGYWFHEYLRRYGLDFSDATLVSKTVTLNPRAGFMPYGPDKLTLAERFPHCVTIRWWSGCVLNAVSLGNPGIRQLLAYNRWQKMRQPFFISVATVYSDWHERKVELELFCRLLNKERPFTTSFGLQLNLSCPNSGLGEIGMVSQVSELLEIARRELPDVPLMVKFSVVTPAETAVNVALHSACDAICVSNAVPWGQCSDQIDWSRLFGTYESPLKTFGGGGLSGAPLRPLVVNWLAKAKALGLSKPICAGGGILKTEDAWSLFKLGADAVSLGSIAILRPWRVRGIIKSCQNRWS